MVPRDFPMPWYSYVQKYSELVNSLAQCQFLVKGRAQNPVLSSKAILNQHIFIVKFNAFVTF